MVAAEKAIPIDLVVPELSLLGVYDGYDAFS